MSEPALPIAKSHRWQLLRSGLINLFHYADEQFWYEDGRLLLRGNNGTGKSRVLALQLPFLLDAELNPTRMEPDRSPSKRPEWNLLLGGKHRDRIGYSYLELGRIDAEGTEHYFTAGCGLHAVKDRGRLDAWFFTTEQRIGRDLDLVVDRVPLVKHRLTEALNDTGQIYRTQGEYRSAIDERLFRLGDRYRTLVDLLIQLRVPQLSRDFDEKRINTQLSDALPPLSSEVLTQVADAMRDLDEQRQRLEETRRSAHAVENFSRNYAAYLKVALQRRVNRFFEKHNQYDRLQRKINEDNRHLQQAGEEVRAIVLSIESAKNLAAEIEAELQVLQSRPEMEDSQRLDRLRDDCESLQRRCDQANTELERETIAFTENRRHVAELTEDLKWKRRAVGKSIDDLAVTPAPPALAEALADVTNALADDQVDLQPLTRVEKAAATLVPGLDRLTQLNRLLNVADAELVRGLDRQSESERRCEIARDSVATSWVGLKQARIQLCDRWQDWYRQSKDQIATLPDLDQWSDRLTVDRDQPSDVETDDEVDQWLDSPNVSVLPIASEAIDRSATVVQDRQATLRNELTLIDHEIETATQRLAELESGVHLPPPAPHPRREDARADRDGAPLYDLVDFVETIPISQRGDWEAGLEASGILDAWVSPGGSLLWRHDGEALGDLFLGTTDEAPQPESNMTAVLRPAAELPAGLEHDHVRGLLARLGCGGDAGDVWFDRDGSWRVGPKHGVWKKPTAEHIGAAARETRRQTLIQQVRQHRNGLQDRHDQTQAELGRCQVQLAEIASVRGGMPDDTEFLRSVAENQAAQRRLVEEDAALKAQIAAVGILRDQRNDCLARRDAEADDLGLSLWKDRLDDLRDCLRRVQSENGSLRVQLQSLEQQIENLRRARQTASDARQRLQRQQGLLAELQREHLAAVKSLETLRANVGQDVHNILNQIAQAKQNRIETRETIETLGRQQIEAAKRQSKLEGKLEEAANTLDSFESDRLGTIAELEWFADGNLLAQTQIEIDVPSTPWSPTRALAIAKEMRSLLTKVRDTDRVWEDSQNELNVQFKTLEQTLLPSGMTPQMQSKDSIFLFRVPYHGVDQTPIALAELMVQEVRSRDALITQQERELFEQRLVGDIALALHQNIRSAYQMCKTMNAEVESRPMSTGMRLRFRWRPRLDANDELKAACQSLLKQPAAMSESEQASLGEFLQNRIAEARTRDEVGTWQHQMAEALDYRTWFAFQIERQTDDKWERLTRRTHGTGSGGERAVALIMPMLAALAAYYHSADPTAPRIILMDEAYVGIDNEMRAKFMDLLVQFDLDFIMTSEREWGCYPTMPALAIYHLATRPGIDAILPTRWVWNGVRCEQSSVHQQARVQELFGVEADDDT